jgi:formylglycine-generating enzyme required for sulfatase activity
MLSLELIKIPASSFVMGSTFEEIDKCVDFWKEKLIKDEFSEEQFRSWIEKEYPAHPVFVKSFKISKYPVTNGCYREFCEATKHPFAISLIKGFPDSHPVWGVTIEDVNSFVSYLANKTGVPFRLPLETEWEYAARGPSRLEYPYGNVFNPSSANTIETGIHTTTPVYKYEDSPSPFGLVDMAGNVEEWVFDCYKPYPEGFLVEDNLIEALGNHYHVLRGGFFLGGGDLSRCARRHGPFPSEEYQYIGFRLACSD